MAEAPAPAADPDPQKYRPDIDGLRAIAVLSVILFHIDKTILPGGFVGVDIFFVISGYLISLHILRDIERGRFSLVEFYRRRIKRIAPAMMVVVAVTLAATQVLFRPEDAEPSAESALWSLLSLANVYFWLHQDTSYFAAASNEKPLLHLWSLGVEEQFYICWPLILMLTYRAWRARPFIVGSVLVAAASFAAGDLLFVWDPSFVYYMLPTRAGELLVGAMAAQVVMRRGEETLPTSVVRFVALVALVTVLGSCVLLSEEQVFPGWRAVPPTLGTAALILAGHYGRSEATQLLRLRPMVWVGLVSYSAYLWHWPLLAVFRYGWGEVGLAAGVVLFALTLLLAWLSYQYVERPARKSRHSALQVFLRQYVVPAGALAVVAAVAMKADGYGLRWLSNDYKKSLAEMRDATRPAYSYDYVCQRQRLTAQDIANTHCVVGDNRIGGQPAALLWGDSNAAHYIGMLGAFARKQGFAFRNVEVGSCPPILGDPAQFVEARRLHDCRESLALLRPLLDAYPVIVVSASWSDYEKRSARFLEIFFDTARALATSGKLVVILGKAPVINTYDRLCWEKALSIPMTHCQATAVPLDMDVSSANERLRAFAAATPNVEYYDATAFLCPGGACSAFNGSGQRIYYDSSHLTLAASWDLGDEIVRRDGVPAPFMRIESWAAARIPGPVR